MKVLTTLGVSESLGRSWPLAVLAEIDHPDGMVRAWSGAGPLDWNGFEWNGVGGFGRVSGIGGSKRLMLRAVTFELSGIPADAEELGGLDENVRNRPARAWLAGLTENGARVNGEPWLVVDGRCDYQTLKYGESGEAVIQLVVAEPVFSIERAQNLAWTPEWIKATRNPDATGLDLMATLASKQVSWTRT